MGQDNNLRVGKHRTLTEKESGSRPPDGDLVGCCSQLAKNSTAKVERGAGGIEDLQKTKPNLKHS
jgi:hypothetical protein